MTPEEAARQINSITDGGECKPIYAEPKPLMFVLKSNNLLTEFDRAELLRWWDCMFDSKPPAPLIILQPGMVLEALFPQPQYGSMIKEERGTYTQAELEMAGAPFSVAHSSCFEARRAYEHIQVSQIVCSPKHREGMLHWIDTAQNLGELKVALKNIELLKQVGFLDKPVEPDEDDDEEDLEDEFGFDLRPIGPGEELAAMMGESDKLTPEDIYGFVDVIGKSNSEPVPLAQLGIDMHQRVLNNSSRPQNNNTAVMDSNDLPDLAENHADTVEQCAVSLPNWGGRCRKTSRWRVSDCASEKLIYCCSEHLANIRRHGDVVEEIK